MATKQVNYFDDGGDVSGFGDDDFGEGTAGQGVDLTENFDYGYGFGDDDFGEGTAGQGVDLTGKYNDYLLDQIKDPTSTQGIDIAKQLNNTFGTNLTGAQWAGMAGIMGGGIAGLAGLNRPGKMEGNMGYQGGIPQLTANRTMVTAPPATVNGQPYRPGQGGVNYGGDVTYTPKPATEVVETTTLAQGGIANLAKGRYLQGNTDGMADKLRTSIEGDQPAALSHGEFVIPADVVSHLGNGNSDAGAKKLYSMMDKIRQARTGSKKQGKQINPDKFMPGGLAYAEGGAVPAGTLGTEQTLAGWTGNYIPNMLAKGEALSNAPYQQYKGPLTAGASDLQTTAFNTAKNLTVPDSVGKAATAAGDIATKAGNISYIPTQATNQFTAPEAYKNTTFTSGTFGNEQAQQYMNPYLQQSLNPQLAEARRQSDITAQQNNAAMTKAGAFGGGRQAILTGENQRNLGANMANITGQGYNTAFTNAMGQYNADQARNMQAQQASEQSKQFGASQSMNSAQNAAQYGQAAQQANIGQQQFGANLGLQGLQTGLQAAQTQGNLGATENQIGLANLNAQGNMGAQQRGITSEGIAADQAAFEEARNNPYKMVQFQQSLLNGLPISAQNYQTLGLSGLQDAAAGMSTVAKGLDTLGLGPKKTTKATN
jgi:hypothetical protein